MVRVRNLVEVDRYLRAIPVDASEARHWQAVTVATRSLMREHGIEHTAAWTVGPLPPQAYRRFGDCHTTTRRIRYSKQFVHEWWVSDLAHTITHEVAHAIADIEWRRQGRPGYGPRHGPMWRGTAAALGLFQAKAHNLPNDKQ